MISLQGSLVFVKDVKGSPEIVITGRGPHLKDDRKTSYCRSFPPPPVPFPPLQSTSRNDRMSSLCN